MKSVLIDRMAEVIGNKRVAEAAYRALLDEMSETLTAGHDVFLHGIGRLHVKTRAARKGRNPMTGEAIDIQSKKTVKFSTFRNLREAVNGLELQLKNNRTKRK